VVAWLCLIEFVFHVTGYMYHACVEIVSMLVI
jgi:hypothetical protein